MATHEDRDSSRGSLLRHPDAVPDPKETLGDQNHGREMDGGKNGKGPGPPRPVGFWDKS